MKNLFLGIALAAATVACQAEQKNAVEPAEAPAAASESDCCAEGEAMECSEEAKAECSSEKAAECSSEEAKVCPVTGQEIN